MTQITYPLSFIDSIAWKLTLPVNKAQEIRVGKTPDLRTYTDPQWFHMSALGDGVVFMARTDGATTSGSGNPRSELREMDSAGLAEAGWSSTVGTHQMVAEVSVDVLPKGSKPVVVVGQIHNASDDVTVFRIEGNMSGLVYGDNQTASIWITKGNTTHGRLLTNAYRLGTKFRIGFSVSGGVVRYSFNDVPLVDYTLVKSFSGAYFKLGSYNQSGGIVTLQPDGLADYAQVTAYAVQVCHNGICTGRAPGSAGSPTATNPEPVEGPPVVMPTTIDVDVVMSYLQGLDMAIRDSLHADIQALIDKLKGLN